MESLYLTFNLSKERTCADSEFHVDGAETEHAREVKLLVMPEGLARRWKVVGDWFGQVRRMGSVKQSLQVTRQLTGNVVSVFNCHRSSSSQ